LLYLIADSTVAYGMRMLLMTTIELVVHYLGITAGLVCLAFAIYQGVWIGMRRPGEQETGAARRVLRRPLLLGLAILWVGLCVALWRPVPLAVNLPWRIGMLFLGGLCYFLGLGLYLWAGRELGSAYQASSAFGVRLTMGQPLVTHGPYAFVRHPSYIALQHGAFGGLLLFRTWTFVFVFVNFLALPLRARQEERALAMRFGAVWDAYRQRVPAWFPRLHRPRNSIHGGSRR
jgi:protein-S-isoprenylcysteine O-methyltransferase Ste14